MSKAPRGFKRVERAQFIKWENVGQTFTGTFIRLDKGSKRGLWIALCADEDGKAVKFSAPSVLAEALQAFPHGSPVHIEFTGTEEQEGGEMKLFDVFTKGD